MVLESARDRDDPRPLVLTEDRWAGRISSADYSGASAPVGSMALPKRVEHRQPRVRRDLASALRSAMDGWEGGSRWTPRRSRTGRRGRGWCVPRSGADVVAGGIASASRPQKLRSAEPRTRSARRSATCASSARTPSWSRRSLPPPTRWPARSTGSSGCSPNASSSRLGHRSQVTDDGRLLARIYSESDLLVAECLRTGAWAGLNPPELAAVVSAVLYETRGGDGPGGPFAAEAPTPRLQQALRQTRGCRPRCAPTSNGTGSPRVVNPTTVSPAPSAGPARAIWPRLWMLPHGRRWFSAVRGGFRALVPTGARPAGPSPQRRPRP